MSLAQNQVLGLAVIGFLFPIDLLGDGGEAYLPVNGILGDVLKPSKYLDLLHPVIACTGGKIQTDISCGDIFRQQQGIGVVITLQGGVHPA